MSKHSSKGVVGISNLNGDRRALAALLEREVHPQRRQLRTCLPDIHGLLMRREWIIDPYGDVVQAPLGYLLYRVIKVPGRFCNIAKVLELAAIEPGQEEICERLMVRYVGMCQRNKLECDHQKTNMVPRPEKPKRVSMDFDWLSL